jgi:hypothetical protein
MTATLLPLAGAVVLIGLLVAVVVLARGEGE